MFGDSSRSYTWVEQSEVPWEHGWRIVHCNYGPRASNYSMDLQLDLAEALRDAR